MLSSLFGFLSALMWGAGDFTGGYASRRGGSYRIAFYGFFVGLICLLFAQLVLRTALPGWSDILWSAAAGMLGAGGLMLLFLSFTSGKISIAASVSALMAAILPVIASTITEGWSGPLTYVGFVLALLAIWLISRGDGHQKALHLHIADLRLPLLAGVLFGFYFIGMNEGSHNSTLWPLIIARASGVFLILWFALIKSEISLPKGKIIPLVLLYGIADIFGNAFFILAGQFGRLDVAAVLGSLYPGMTVLLAAVILHEKLNRNQWLGIAAALGAIVLMTI